MELELKNIRVVLSKKEILKGINLRVRAGEFVSLLGASGCGKSTTLKTIAGIISQDEGVVKLGGRVADKTPSHKRETVIVFQDLRLFPHMTVGENIGFPMKMRGLGEERIKRLVDDLLEKVQLPGYGDRNVSKISGGQIQRIALARALAAEPRILLLDEPFSSLDVNLRKDMRDLMMELHRDYNMTTLMVTHDKEEALTMSDKIAFMDQGEILQYDGVEEIYNNPRSKKVADYFLDGTYVEGKVEDGLFISQSFKFKTNKEDGDYLCLIRIEGVKVLAEENGSYKIIGKLYQGSTYKLKLENLNTGICLEAEVSESVKIQIGDRVGVKIEEEKLVFLNS